MSSTSVFDYLEGFAKRKARDGEMTSMHYLYGYVQLLGIKESMVETLFSSEEDKAEYARLVQLVKEYKIDLNVLKQGIPLLLTEGKAGNSLQEMLNHATIKNEKGSHISVDLLFKEIVDSENLVLKLFSEGKTVEDVLAYKRERIEDRAEDLTEDSQKESASESKDVKRAETIKKVESTKEMESTKEVTDAKFDQLALQSRHLYNTLREYVQGQDDAIRIFVQGYFQAQLISGVKNAKGTPKGIFLFAGPPGVGKTYLATTAADILKLPVKRFNMSEYSDHQSAMELIGLSKKYAGAKSGALTSFVKKYPKSILIFDEVEKAHLNVIHLFLQILDVGTLQDSFEEENVSFQDTMIIFTTNVGKRLYEENREQNLSLLSQSVILDALEKEKHPLTGHALFPTAICSRFATGNVIMFNHLNCHHLLKITEKNFRQCAEMFAEKYGYELSFDRRLSSVFLFHVSSNMDARIISSQSGQFIRNELYEFARQAVEQIDFQKLEQIQFSVNIPEEDSKMTQLFIKKRIEHLLVISKKEVFASLELEKENICVHYADTCEAMEKILVENDIRLVLIDPMYGYRKGLEKGVFSMEDYDTEGISCFNTMRIKMPHMPVYMLETEKQMREVDQNTFQQQGARGIVSCLEKTQKNLREQVCNLLDMIYLQEKVNELSRQEKVLDYNTAQMVSKDGKTATIEFYDFKLHTAVKADNQNTVLSEAKKPKTRFADIVGAKNAQEELKYFINYLKNPKEFMLRGVKAPKGVLLYGPPGTGKTMLAKAMAGEADVTFLPTTATDFFNKYVGEGEDRIRGLFATAKKYAPSVIFIDEIDAIGKERTGESTGRHAEGLLNTLLTEMDGFSFDPQRPIFVLAATNFPLDHSQSNGKAVIDPALLRRFDNKIHVDLPDQEERKEFLLKRTKHMKNCTLTEKAMENIASRTTGESLANLQNIIDLAFRNAEKAGCPLSDEMLLAAMEEYYYGEEHKWGRSYYESVAHHEAGHAYICRLSGVKPAFITIVSRGDFGGYMQSSSDDKVPCYTKQQLLWRIRTALAGRAAELVFYGEEAGTNTGVSGDLESATNLALQMICRYGMAGNSLISISPDRILNMPMGAKVLESAQKILEEEMQKTIELIEQGKDKIDSLAKALLEKNQLISHEIEEILS